jgi:HPr kinase/phosphorylase
MIMNQSDPTFRSVTVGAFFGKHSETLKMTRVGRCEGGLDRKISEPTVNRPGLALAGFFSYFAEKRIQVMGWSELSYLASLPKEAARERCCALFDRPIPCVVVAREEAVPEYLLREADIRQIPVFVTPLVTMTFLNTATVALSQEFAPQKNEFGCMVDILGIGTLIRGKSAIGKSECVLGLLERGHSLVSDDVTKFKLMANGDLFGTSSDVTRNHMEVRGLGVINVMSIFGIGSIRLEKRLDLAVTFKEWDEVEEVDRTGLEREYYGILGVQVPHVTIPVRMGRDLARLVEVAALNQKLRSAGHDSAHEFRRRLLRIMGNNA